MALATLTTTAACGSPASGVAFVTPPASPPDASSPPAAALAPPAGSPGASPSSPAPSRSTSSPAPRRAPTPARTTAATSSLPPNCVIGDMTYSMSLGSSGGDHMPGSLVMKNVSGKTCRVHGYAPLTWRDASGAAIAITIVRRRDPQLAGAYLIPPGERAVVGFDWQRWQTGTTTPCTPAPKTLVFRLEEGATSKQTAWFPAADGGMCGSTVEVTNIQRAP